MTSPVCRCPLESVDFCTGNHRCSAWNVGYSLGHLREMRRKGVYHERFVHLNRISCISCERPIQPAPGRLIVCRCSFALGVSVHVQRILTNAGFEEGSFAGLKWKRSLVDTDNQLRVAQEAIIRLRSTNSDLTQALSQQSGAKGSKKTADLTAESRKVSETAEQVQNSLALTLQNNSSLVDRARISLATGPPSEVAYCYQEDRGIPGPEREPPARHPAP